MKAEDKCPAPGGQAVGYRLLENEALDPVFGKLAL